MCGILFIKRLDHRAAQKQAVKRYQGQKSRGIDGYGIVAIGHSGKIRIARAQFEHEFLKQLESSNESTILVHHRYPTSTPNVIEATHPILVSHPELVHDYYVMHNGIIYNADELKREHEKLSYLYNTEIEQSYKARSTGELYGGDVVFNDSEALAIELARNIEGKQSSVHARGPIAYILLQTDKAGNAKRMYYGTNGDNPLIINRTKEFISISSEGNGNHLSAHSQYVLDLATNIIEPTQAVRLLEKEKKVGYDYSQYEHKTNRTLAWDDEASEYTPYKRTRRKDTRDESVEELEQQLEDIEADISLIKDEGQTALDSGDTETEDLCHYELKELMNERTKVEKKLETKLLTQTYN